MDIDPKEFVFKDIFKEVCRYYNVTMLDVISDRRTAKIMKARHMVVHIAMQRTRLNRAAIASRLNRTRWTIQSSIERVELLLQKEEFPKDFEAIIRRLGG